jgi:hypothetical protein
LAAADRRKRRYGTRVVRIYFERKNLSAGMRFGPDTHYDKKLKKQIETLHCDPALQVELWESDPTDRQRHTSRVRFVLQDPAEEVTLLWCGCTTTKRLEQGQRP